MVLCRVSIKRSLFHILMDNACVKCQDVFPDSALVISTCPERLPMAFEMEMEMEAKITGIEIRSKDTPIHIW